MWTLSDTLWIVRFSSLVEGTGPILCELQVFPPPFFWMVLLPASGNFSHTCAAQNSADHLKELSDLQNLCSTFLCCTVPCKLWFLTFPNSQLCLLLGSVCVFLPHQQLRNSLRQSAGAVVVEFSLIWFSSLRGHYFCFWVQCFDKHFIYFYCFVFLVSGRKVNLISITQSYHLVFNRLALAAVLRLDWWLSRVEARRPFGREIQ